MHDGITFDLRGIPAVVICSEAFTNTAKSMARTFGLPDYKFALIPHPVAGNTIEELAEKAELVYKQAVEILSGRQV